MIAKKYETIPAIGAQKISGSWHSQFKERRSMAHVLITGGAGFVGSHLAELYLAEGNTVSIIDDLSTGSVENLSHLVGDAKYSSKLHFVKDTVLNREALEPLVKQADIIIHFAAAVGVRYIIENPLSSFVVNIGGTELVLQLADKYKKKVLITSTSEVYGKQTHAPLRESDDCVYGSSSKLRWSYAGSKLMDEFYALAYHRSNNLPVVVVRLFNTVGPRQTGSYGMVLPRFVAQALRGEPLTVFGDGSQTRTFTHVGEVIHAVKALMEQDSANGEVVNIGGVEEISILDLAKRVIERSDSNSSIDLIPYDEAYPSDFEDMARRVPSTEKLRSLIGFAPEYGVNRIIDDVITYHRSFLGELSESARVANL